MGQVQHRDWVKIEELLSIREASEQFQVGPYTLYRLAESGKIPTRLVDNAWRFKKEDLYTWIAGSPYDRRIRKERRQCDAGILAYDRRCGKDRRLK